MTSRNTEKIVLAAIFVSLLISGCKSTVEKLAISTCRTVETNIARCSEIIADDISDKNGNTLSSVKEGDL